MTQEEKDLLLKDLCGRLPYRMRFKTKHGFDTLEDIDCFDLLDIRINIGNEDNYSLDEIKPYLFPLSSMSEEQREEFLNIQAEERKILFDALIEYRYGKRDKKPVIAPYKQIEWLNKNHFDYRGLIEKGLALDASELNIY